MSYDGRLLRLAQERYEADRSIREAEQAARREAIYTSRPRLREIDEELRRTASRVLAAALRRGQDPLPEIQRLKEQNLSLQEERKGLLAELGLTETALEETPLCPLCGDTGYRGGEICRCLKVYYVEEQRKELSKLLDLGGQSFDTFDTDWYSDQRAPGKSKSAREHMERVYDTCVEYAHNFGKRPANLLLFGRPGLGKTHLSAAIAREVSGKGFSVVYDTFRELIDKAMTLKISGYYRSTGHSGHGYSESFSRGYPVGSDGNRLFYCKEIDTYFIMYCYKSEFVSKHNDMKWYKYYNRLMPVNQFGDYFVE